MLERHGKGTDDALAAVVRYLGPPASQQVLPAPTGGGRRPRRVGPYRLAPGRTRGRWVPRWERRRPAGTFPGMNSPRNLAASAGRWSAQHRKTAIIGWILFVVLATFAGKSIGQKTPMAEMGNGESKRSMQIMESADFPETVGEQS